MKDWNRGLKLVGLFVVLVSLQASAIATYTPSFLPESSLWQGSRFYNQNGVNAYVEYAVYDRWSEDYQNVFNSGATDSFPTPTGGTGEYVYAYEIYNYGSSPDFSPVAMFELIGGNPANASGTGFETTGAGADAISPTSSPTTSDSAFVWKFAGGIFVADKNSAFLVFTSDKGPVAGSFKLSTLSEGGDEPPVNPGEGDTPEPATLALLAGGAISLLTKRHRK